MNTREGILRGLANVSFFSDDLGAARTWYADFLGLEPYFVRDGYIEFRLGDHHDELGIVDRWYAPAQGGPAGAIPYWHVDDVATTYQRALDRGAAVHDEIRERGEGFVTASVTDPFGNVLAFMSNPNWLENAATA